MKTLKGKDWFDEQDFPFKIVRLSSIKSYPGHKHDFFEFFYVTKGEMQHVIEGKENRIVQGDIVLLNPSLNHSFEVAEGMETGTIQCIFMPSFLQVDHELLKSTKGFIELIFIQPFYKEGFRTFHLTGKIDLKIRNLLEEMLYEFTERPDGYKVAIKTKLTDLLISVARAYDREDRDQDTRIKSAGTAEGIADILIHIDNHFTEDLFLDDLASKHAGVTKEYFCTVFKNITGKTFVHYLNDLRINHAKHLLESTDKQIIRISLDSGFNDLSHFNRTFKKITGVSPTQYRKKQS